MITILLSMSLAFWPSKMTWVTTGPEMCWSYKIIKERQWEKDYQYPCTKDIGESSSADYNEALTNANRAADHTLEACFRADSSELFCFPIHRGKAGS